MKLIIDLLLYIVFWFSTLAATYITHIMLQKRNGIYKTAHTKKEEAKTEV
jgi:hypothetical protein